MNNFPKKIVSRKFLIRDLKRNIKSDSHESYEYNDCIFEREGDSEYYISSPKSDIGIVHIDKIDDFFLKMNCSKHDGMKKTKIKPKKRKTKRYDIIQNEFMEFVGRQTCMVSGCVNPGRSEAHHIFGRQPARIDILCVPLCAAHHRGSKYSVHEGDVRTFRTDYTKEFMSKAALEILEKWINSEAISILSEERIVVLRNILEFMKQYNGSCGSAIKEFIIKNGRN